MNAEALIGTTLGTCTLQRLIGQGGMGAVFLAQQSRPRRQVAVKVLLPMTPLTPNQLAAFLERFRRETDAAASLEHPNIMPVHEYGERDGLAYLVMPYIGGGTLRDELEREGALALSKAANYLEQMASALDFAHEHGVVHRDIKPANILLTPEGRLLLADFGLVKIISEGQGALMRLTGPGAPVGTPDYMAPEQVIGDEVDGRSDLYSLGVMLYQMVTGVTPFQGETPMQIANQHLQIAPPSPRLMRPDLPIAAEQVLLRSLAKHPSERYARGQDLVQAFAISLLNAGIVLGSNTGVMPSMTMSGATGTRLYTPKGLFDPSWQSSSMPAVTGKTGMFPAATAANDTVSAANANGGLLSRTGMFPATPNATPPANGGLLSRTGMFPTMPAGARPGITGQIGVQPSAANVDLPPPSTRGGLFAYTGKFAQVGPLETGSGIQTVGSGNGRFPVTPPETSLEASGMSLEPQPSSPMLDGNTTTTGSWLVPGQQLGSGTVKLTGPVKVIQVPVAGQPGRYMTGLLPVMAMPQEPKINAEAKKKEQMWVKVVAMTVMIVLLFGSAAGFFWYLRMRPTQQATTASPVKATAAVSNANTTPDPKTANVILSDPLKTNIHNWPTTAPDYFFKDGAYHLANHHNGVLAPILQGLTLTEAYTYSLTIQEIAGDDTSPNNNFGMIFRFSQQQKGNTKVTTFYSFEVVNMKGGEYQLWKYDDSQGTGVSPWTKIWHTPLGDEFHLGHGPQSTNVFKVVVNGDTFTLIVNGKTLAQSVKDGSLANGMVGLLVNLQGTEVAFSNMLLTRQ